MSDSASLFKAVFDTSIQAMIVIDAAGIIQQYNPAAEKLLQYSKKEVLGKNVNLFMPKAVARHHNAYLRNYQKTHEPHIIGTGREVQARKKNGDLADVFLSVNEVKYQKEVLYVGVLHEITAEKNLRLNNQKLIDFNSSIINDLHKINSYQDLIKMILP